MSDTNNKQLSDLLAAKKAAVLEQRGKKRKLVLPVAGLVLLLGLVGFFGLRMMPEEVAKPAAEGAMFGFVPTTGEVVYPLSDFDETGVNFYQHKADGGVLVRYFVHVGADWTVTAALDTCGSCWQSARGHRHEGAGLTCLTCDKRFELVGLDEVSDPCKPIAVPAQLRDGKVVIAITDLLSGAKYFKKPQQEKGS